ncbi:DsrE family protein [Allorhodopirellula solitaria]|uniref:DsrE family protein n=1 Tax=Allorhodopirellula solitaria TaxID=2527987 RepID=UPI0016493E29|nr:DsrE family protein [Allorhodopirellula solitaria]
MLEPLFKAARIANLYAQAGVGPKQGMQLALVLHGDATKAALSNTGYQQHFGQEKNPNLPLIQQLTQAGVKVFVCGQALAHHKYALEKVTSSVTVTDSAASVNVNKQLDGFAYLPFH